METAKKILRVLGLILGGGIVFAGLAGFIAGDYGPALAFVAVGAGLLFLCLRRSPEAKAEAAIRAQARRSERFAKAEQARADAERRARQASEERARQEELRRQREQASVTSTPDRRAHSGQPGSSGETQQSKQAQNTARCPFCGSTSLSASRRGYKLSRGLFWALALGFFNFWLGAFSGALIGAAIGLCMGNIGSRKMKVVCLNCGREHKPRGSSAVEVADYTPANGSAGEQEPYDYWEQTQPTPPDFEEYMREIGLEEPDIPGRKYALACVLADMSDDKERAVLWAYAVDCARQHRTMGNVLRSPDYHKYRAFGEYASRHGDVLRSIADRRSEEYWNPTTTTKAYRAAAEFLK